MSAAITVPNSLPQILTYGGGDALNCIQVSSGNAICRQALSYTSANISGTSQWVKQQ